MRTSLVEIWEPDEAILDCLSLSIGGLPPGTYKLHFGWCAVDDEQRLTACPTGQCAGEKADSYNLNMLEISLNS